MYKTKVYEFIHCYCKNIVLSKYHLFASIEFNQPFYRSYQSFHKDLIVTIILVAAYRKMPNMSPVFIDILKHVLKGLYLGAYILRIFCASTVEPLYSGHAL